MTLKKVWHFLCAPLFEGRKLFSAILSASLLYYLLDIVVGHIGISVLLASLFLTYFVTLILSCLPDFLRRSIGTITVLYAHFSTMLAFWGFVFLNNALPLNTLCVILQSNANETKEFFTFYLNERIFLLLIVGILSPVVMYLICSWAFRTINAKLKQYFVVVILLSSLIFVRWPQACLSTCFFSYFQPDQMRAFSAVDLRDYKYQPTLISTTKDKPATIVLLMGESLSKSHCSLYGYAMPTNPNLEKLSEDGSLDVFPHVSSSQVGTGVAFKDIMSTYSSRNRGEDWAACQTIPTIMEAGGYETYWISNQSCMGLFDAIPNKYAKLCEHVQFSSHDGNLDEVLFPMVAESIDSTKNQFFVIHLMGNHEEFSQRYGTDFARFNAEDYSSCPEWQRQTVAEYDNSVLYNDYVVSTIMNQFAEMDAIVVYFSDHALDIYESDDKFVGHSRATEESRYYGKQIPFVVYTTDLFSSKHPDLMKKLRAKKNVEYCTEDIVYFLMDVAGCKFKDNDDVSQYSLLSL